MLLVSSLVRYLLPDSPTAIQNLVLQYCGLFSLLGYECRIIYDAEQKCHKLYNIERNRIAVSNINCNIASIFNYKEQIEIFKCIKNTSLIEWIPKGDKFDFYNIMTANQKVLTVNSYLCISPSDELYTVSSMKHNLDTFIYDKKNNVILNRTLSHVAILLSMGFGAPRLSTKNDIIDTSKLFDATKILQILPQEKSDKLNEVHRVSYIKVYCIKWVPVNTKFVVYYNDACGENFKLESEFRYKA